ncbi:DNA methyltransferase [Fibrella aquatica]|uniref:DNA methyltransferase n=1 Tax=Fibrella aquatica TaxID=3242487 RepID=UPI003522CE04
MKSRALLNILSELNLLATDAVYFRESKSVDKFNNFSAEIIKKINIIQPDAFYIFNNQPYILFFDLSKNVDSLREREIHKQVWSFDNSPLIFIIKNDEIKLFNAFDFNKNKQELQEILLTPDERRSKFSFWQLQSGESWEWLQQEYYKNNITKKRVNHKLFENIKSVREILMDPIHDNPLNEDKANILILRLIFIRYLIDRNVQLDEQYIRGSSIIERRRSFSLLVQDRNLLIDFFNALNSKLNGVLFEDVDINITEFQAEALSFVFSDAKHFGQDSFFRGTDFYFEIFDFSIIPVEVISGIYESLISPDTRDEQSAIYTPAYIVEYILTETVDKYINNSMTAECKVFDPACGSGIFLVQAYRRMVDKEIATIDKKITKTRLKEIAQNNLFGIDLNAHALKVTCFSIYIALLDYQDPKTILDNFVFPELINENLFQANFFDLEHPFNKKIKIKSLDFILGNPPWKSNKELYHLNWLKGSGNITGRYEIAQSFLIRSKDFMEINTVSALIVTSTLFYNVSDTTKEFKRKFLTTFCLDLFFDLSPVRKLIFEEKNSPAAIVYFRLSDGREHLKNIVKHISIKSNIFLKHFKSIVIEKQDYKNINQIYFLDNDWMFKLAVYGGPLDFNFLKRLNRIDYKVKDLLSGERYVKGDGIYKGTPKRNFNFLVNKSIIETEGIEKYYTNVNVNNVLTENDVFLESGRKESLFAGHSILLKHRTKDETDIVVSFVDRPVVFRHGVYGITSENNIDELKLLYGYFISRLFTYYQFLTSSAWGVATRPEIKLDEYISFPFLNPAMEVKKEVVAKVDTFISHLKNWYNTFDLGQPPFSDKDYEVINSIVQDIYKITPIEKNLIDYVYDVSRFQFQASRQYKFSKKVNGNKDFLDKYIKIFIDQFSNIYEDEDLRIDVYPLNYFIAMNFSFSNDTASRDKVIFHVTDTDEKEVLRRLAEKLSISQIVSTNDPSKNLYIQKDIKGFEENSFYIIKPNEYKCWHSAIAWHDVAEIRDAIEQAEINHLTTDSNES